MKLIFFFICFVATVRGAILGIDYGQQFTKAVLLAPGISFEIVHTDDGKRKDLSGISIRENDGGLERVYGSATGSLCTRFPQSCIMGLKPLLGKSVRSGETQQFLGRNFGIKLASDEARAEAIKFDLGLANDSYKFAIEEVFAMNLHELKGRALKTIEQSPLAQPIVEEVVVSIAPFATHETKQAYLDGLALGFSNVLGLVDEGSAVALNYISNKKFEKADFNNEKEYHIVYDMGAGSTTATLFSFTPFTNESIVLELESIGYDEAFGGQLFTQSVNTIILEKFLSYFGLKDSTKLPPKTLARILEVAEKAKIVLSINSDYHVSLENIYENKDFKTTVSKDEFEEINSDLMEHITKPIKDALRSSSPERSIEDIKSVILNGGSIRVPFVQNHLATLLGQNRISKTVNADESCALGTTLQGLNLKTKLGKAKDITIIEKSYHNYEIKVDDGEVDQLVFPRGSQISKSSRIDLGIPNKGINIGLYEDGRLFKSYKFDDFLKKVRDLSCPSKQEKKLFATFSLDHNKMFDLSKFEVECTSNEEKGGFFQKLLKKEGDASEEVDKEDKTDTADNKNSTNATENDAINSSKRKSKQVSINIPKPVYPHIKPMSSTTKERTTNRLAYLNSKDESRIELEHIKNTLEGRCYELRAFIEDHEDEILKEMTSNELSEYSSFVRDTIEWLEFESDNCSIDDFRTKIEEVGSKKKSLDSIIQMSKADTSFAGMKKLYEDGTSMAMQIQNYMLESGTQISEVRQKYEKENFDFDKENDRIKLRLLKEGGDKMMTLDRGLAKFKEILTKVGEFSSLSEKEYDKIPKKQVYEIYDAATEKIVEMLADIVLLQESHQKRIDTFNDKFNKLLERKNKKELRDKLKQEEAEKKAENEDKGSSDAEAENENGFIEEESDSEPPANPDRPSTSGTYQARDSYRTPRREDNGGYEYQERARERVRDSPYRERNTPEYGDRRGGRDDRLADKRTTGGNYRPARPSLDTRNGRERYSNNRNYRDRSEWGDQQHTYRPRYDDRQQKGRQRVPAQETKPKLTKEQEIERCEKRLVNLQKVPSIEEVSIIDSKWGVKPKGFENVTAQRAKLSGLFPLPGYPRPVDFTKLEGVARDRLLNSNDILNGSSKIDPIDSRNSSILFIRNINFGLIDYLKITEYFNKFLSLIDIPETTLNNIESKRKTKDDQNLIIEFKNNTCATIAIALNNRELSFNEMKLMKNDDEGIPIQQLEQENKEEHIVLEISRPGEYVVQCLPPYSEIKEDIIEETIMDSPRKITLLVSPTLTETELVTNIKDVGTIKGFQLLREIGTKKSLGIAFLEFYIDPYKYQKTIKAIPVIEELIENLKGKPFVKNAHFSCIIPSTTSIQDCPIELNSLKKLVRNEHVTTHPRLRVIQLINIVSAKDLMDDANFKFIQKDILQEVSKFGNVKTIKIPRPANDYTPGISQFSQPGLGRIYVEFDDEEVALNAIMGLAGRMYNDRTVLCSFYDSEDFKNGLL